MISASPSTISGLQRDGNRSTQSEAGSINQGVRVCTRCSARDQFALLSSYASRRAITPHQSTLSLSVPCSATRVAVPEPDGDRYVFQCRRSPPQKNTKQTHAKVRTAAIRRRPACELPDMPPRPTTQQSRRLRPQSQAIRYSTATLDMIDLPNHLAKQAKAETAEKDLPAVVLRDYQYGRGSGVGTHGLRWGGRLVNMSALRREATC